MKSIHDNLKPSEAIDTLEQIQGKFPGARRAHAKGQVYEANFTPNGNAIPYTTATHLQYKAVSAVVRFSNSPPDPTAADFLSPAKGMSVQFHLPDGGTSHLVSTTVPMFVTKNPESFIEMIQILTADKTGIKKVDIGLSIMKIIRKYPENKNTLLMLKEIAKQPPTSYATLHYYPIHAFYLVNKEGERQPIKYEWQPAQEEKILTKSEAKTLSPDFLSEELDERLERGPVTFNLIIRLGEEGDKTDDPTDTWPEDRKRIIIGQLAIHTKQLYPSRDLFFDPTIVSKGIELTDDPVLHFRHDAYAVSFNRRIKNE